MRFGDLLALPLAAMWQQKLRTLLTTLGVVFGSFVLAASLSIGQGVQDTLGRFTSKSIGGNTLVALFEEAGQFWRIDAQLRDGIRRNEP